MTNETLVAALQAYAAARKVSVRRATDLYAVRCILGRLQQLEEGAAFKLKGGMLVTALLGQDLRTTRDADLLAPGSPSQVAMKSIFGRAAELVTADGLSIRLPLRTKQARTHIDGYNGIGLSAQCTVAGTLPGSIKLDIGFGDIAIPDGGRIVLRPMFPEMEAVEVGAYAPEALLAEKTECLLSNFPARIKQRLKDFFDISAVTRNLDRPMVRSVVASSFDAVFKQRGTSFEEVKSLAIMAVDLPADSEMQREWKAFRSQSGATELSLGEAIAQTRAFVEPVLTGLQSHTMFESVWTSSKGWVATDNSTS